jgi:hypothetical protein
MRRYQEIAFWFLEMGLANACFLQLGELNFNEQIHEYDMQINDLQMAPDRTYFITAGKDKTAKVWVEGANHLSLSVKED